MSRLLVGSALLVSMSFAIKLIGMASTVVLARLLVPEDFGVVALALLVTGFVNIFTTTGGKVYVIRASEISGSLVNSAWTLNLLLKLCVAFALLIAAEPIAIYYNNVEIAPVLRTFAAITVIDSLGSPGLWLLERDQNFGRIVSISIVAKIISAVTAVTLALAGAQHWALVFGQLVNSVMMTSLSYLAHAHRPVLDVSKARQQFKFSIWLILQSIFGYSRVNLDVFLVSRIFGQEQLGSFHTLKYVAYIPSESILLPATQPLLSELSRNRENSQYFEFLHNVCFISGFSIALPIAVLMYLNAEALIQVVLGDNWTPYSSLFSSFCFLIPAYFFFLHANRICIVFGRSRTTFMYEIFALVVVFVPVLLLGMDDLFAFTSLRVTMELIASFLFVIFAAARFVSISTVPKLLIASSPILIASGLATGVIFSITLPDPSVLSILVCSSLWTVVFGACIFSLTFLGPWHRSPEWSYLIGKLRSFVEAWRPNSGSSSP